LVSEWVPIRMTLSVCDITPRGLQMSAALIANSSCAERLFVRVADQCACMLCTKDFAH